MSQPMSVQAQLHGVTTCKDSCAESEPPGRMLAPCDAVLCGSEGIQSHYDDAGRFDRPIYSLRLFSDSRLSFGTQLYGCACSRCTQLPA